MKILYAEDEKELSNAVVKILSHNNYLVDAVENGKDAYDYALAGKYDCIILDIMMPQMDGIEVLTKLRLKGIDAPILLLTAKTEIEDRIQGLDNGADDYLTKPFAMGELLARIRAMLRRKPNIVPDVLQIANVSLNKNTYELFTDISTQRLTAKEMAVMQLFMENPSSIFSTDKLMESVWGFNSESEINVVWVCISSLRKKLTEVQAKLQIKATRGVGSGLEELK